MLKLFKETVLWKILNYFLSHPSTSIYVKQLSRELKISPSGTNQALKSLAEAKILFREEKGKAHYYNLDNDLPFVKYLKVAHFLAVIENLKIEEKFKKLDENLISLILYGSYAKGEYDERSDVDLIIISSKFKKHFLPLIQYMERFLNREVSLEVFNIPKWLKIKRENPTFYKEIVNSYILLTGSELP